MTALGVEALRRLDAPGRAALARFPGEDLENPDASVQSDYARASFPAWSRNPLASLVPLPSCHRSTAAAVAAQLRSSGYDWLNTSVPSTVPRSSFTQSVTR